MWRATVCPENPAESSTKQISIIIPARNEERVLPELLKSIAGQDQGPLEVIVLDDASTDRTAEIARSYDARVVRPPELPSGWRGKTWACHHGAEAARGEMYLFLDADTRLLPDALGRMMAAYRDSFRVLSLGPYHEVKKPYEQMSAIFNLLTFMGMGVFGVFGSTSKPYGLFGPVLLIDREVYKQAGGHAAVRSEILENMSLWRLLADRNIPMQCLNGRGVIHTRMYPDGFFALCEGWTKAFAAGASKTRGATLILSVLWMIGGMLAFIAACLVGILPSHFGLGYLVPYAAYAVSLYLMLRQIGRFRWWSALCYPVLFMAFFVIFARSAILRLSGGPVTWKGRSISAAAEEQAL